MPLYGVNTTESFIWWLHVQYHSPSLNIFKRQLDTRRCTYTNMRKYLTFPHMCMSCRFKSGCHVCRGKSYIDKLETRLNCHTCAMRNAPLAGRNATEFEACSPWHLLSRPGVVWIDWCGTVLLELVEWSRSKAAIWDGFGVKWFYGSF